MIYEKIKKLITEAGEELGLLFDSVHLEHPAQKDYGDYSTNVAFQYARKFANIFDGHTGDIIHADILAKNPYDYAIKIKEIIEKKCSGMKEIEKIEVAGNGFINFFLSQNYYSNTLTNIFGDENFGKGDVLSGKKAVFEYTDPNPFKAFHIGHLMSNAIGESLSRLAEFQNGNVIRMSYGGDVGQHVAKAIWGMQKMKVNFPHDEDLLSDKVKFIGDSYVYGNTAFEEDEKSKEEIKEINKRLFEKSDPELQIYYDKGKKWSIELFESIYKKLGTKFDSAVWESEVSDEGIRLVKENVPNIFEESEGAIVFKGENYGLHTRVFLNSQGLPTYEAKELGLFSKKQKEFPHDISISITGNEQNDYFKVLHKVFELLDKEGASKFSHIPHGMLRFTEGKMSSRKGNIITGESLITNTEEAVLEKMKDREIEESEKKAIATKVAISAIKYSILKQSPGKDIIFDREKALSFEGDSGPYLLYSCVRAKAVLQKANEAGISPMAPKNIVTNDLIKKLVCFPEITETAWIEKSPQKIVEYTTELCSLFNAFYAQEKIINNEDSLSAERVGLVSIFESVLEKALCLLGISTVSKM